MPSITTSAMSALPCPAPMRRGDVVPGFIERVADTDALPWPTLAGGEAHRVALAAHQHGNGEIAALGGAQDRNELSFGGGECHDERPSLAARRSVSLMRVCQPGPVARKCSTTSASMRSLSACLGLADGGRPRRISLSP